MSAASRRGEADSPSYYADFKIADKSDESVGLQFYGGNAASGNTDPSAKMFVWEQNSGGPDYYSTVAQAAIAAANKALESKDAATARQEFERAVYFHEAQANRRSPGANLSAGELVQVEQLRGEQVAEWKKAAPKLMARLELVLRDVSVEDAVAQVARAAGIAIEVVPGSVSDAAAMADDTRVHYLDLRHASVADALDWILLPARLTWQPDGEKVRVASRRRLTGISCWVYDVADMALPRYSELGTEQAKPVEKAEAVCNMFLAAVRKAAEAKEENVQWFAPGELFVVGDAATHAKAAAFFAELLEPKNAEKSELHQLAQARTANRKAGRAAAQLQRAQDRALAAIDAHGWPLLAAAAGGRLDVEALTELEIAWKTLAVSKRSEVADLLVLRMAWIVDEAARSLPEEKELAEFAKQVAADTREITQAVVAAIGKAGEHSATQFAAATYAAMAGRDNVEFSGGAYEAITAATTGPNDWLTRTLVPALFGRGGANERAALIELVRSARVAGEDAVVLTALACRRAGGEPWSTFRAEATTLLGRQPLAGAVVVFVNELSAARLPLIAATQ
ncbi:MAG: hypothetical protein WD669_04850 [Pirellulales bacterium]